MSKRTEQNILDDLSAAREQYAALASDSNSTSGQVQEAASKVSALTNELGEYVTQGAEPCKKCGNAPMGMLKTPAHTHNGVDLPNTWEVGCIYCEPYLAESENGTALLIDGETKKVKRRSYSARGFSPAEAVRKWNEDEWVEDVMFERMRGFTPEYT